MAEPSLLLDFLAGFYNGKGQATRQFSKKSLFTLPWKDGTKLIAVR